MKPFGFKSLLTQYGHTHPKYAPNVTLFCLGSYSLGKERDLVQFLAFLVRLFFWGNCTGFHLQGPYFSLESFEMRCCQAAATAPSGGTRSYLSKCLLASGGDSGGADTPALPAPGVSAFLLPWGAHTSVRDWDSSTLTRVGTWREGNNSLFLTLHASGQSSKETLPIHIKSFPFPLVSLLC